VTTHNFNQQNALIKNNKRDHKTHFKLRDYDDDDDDDDDNNTTAHKVHTTNSAQGTMLIVFFAAV